MIRYALVCGAGHAFESWFRDSTAFDEQAREGHVSCPYCGSTAVAKQVMAPALASQEPSRGLELRGMLRALHQHIRQNAENVGAAFAEEARRIHYGETMERAIYGQASLAEAQDLIEEGIAVLPLPEANN